VSLKILLISNTADLYGAGRSLLRLVRRLSVDGNDVEVVLPDEGPLMQYLLDAGAFAVVQSDLAILKRRCFTSIADSLSFVWSVFRSTVRLVVHIRRTRPDLVHTNSSVIISAALAARICGVPHIWHVREFLSGESKLWNLYGWYMWFNADAIVCVSRAVALQFPNFVQKTKIHVVYNGVPKSERFNDKVDELGKAVARIDGRKGRANVGVVGRIKLDQKGQDVFIRAAGELVGSHPDVRFVIAGSAFPGNEHHTERLRCLVAELGLGDRVFFTGDVADPHVLYPGLDVCVLPAVKPEALGNVLLEAMAFQIAVVGTAVGGIPEVIEHGVNGLVVEPNDVSGLVSALDSLLRNPEMRGRMAEAGRLRYERVFEFESCYSGIIALYGKVTQYRKVAL
jgi:glycosyltransferase involved in cell wall biosynthesis